MPANTAPGLPPLKDHGYVQNFLVVFPNLCLGQLGVLERIYQ